MTTKPGAGAVVTREQVDAEIAQEDATRRHATALLEALGLESYEDDEDGTEFMVVDPDELGQAVRFIADAELRGQRSRDAEVDGLQRELAELRSQANEYGAHPGEIAGKGAVTDGLTTNFAAHRETYLKALEAVELVGGILAEDAGAGKRNAHQFYAAAVTKLREGVTPESLAAKAATVTDEQLADDIAFIRQLLAPSGLRSAGIAMDRITAALARGGK